MRTLRIFLFSILSLIALNVVTRAQAYEVPTGPFLDSSNYVAPAPMFYKTDKTNKEVNFTAYKQCNQTWSSSSLGTCTNTICNSGCAMTVVAMLLTANGVSVTPAQLNTWLTNNSGYANGCEIYWAVAANYPGSTLKWYASSSFLLSTIKSEIDGGNPVIVKVDHPYNGTGSCSHWVMVYGYNNSGTSSSDFLVSDPGTVTCPTGCNLSYYTICSTTYPLRLYHNVTSGTSCTIANITPTLVSPGSSSAPGTTLNTTTPTLSWNAVSGATNYGVYIKDIATNALVVDNNCATSATSYTVPAGILANNKQYKWNIQANVSCGTCVSSYSTAFYFQTPANNLPDLVVQNAQLTPSITTLGGSVTTSFYIKNQGMAASGQSVTAMWFSYDQTFNAGVDVNLGDVSVPALNAGATSTQLTKQIQIPMGPYSLGTWYIMFGCDATEVVNEGSNESNNQTFVPITIGSRPPDNDEPSNATQLDIGSSCAYVQNTIIGATKSTQIPDASCDQPSNVDVWFKFTIPNGTFSIRTNSISISSNDCGMAIYTGTPSSMIERKCIIGGNPNQPYMPWDDKINLSTYAGQTGYIRVWEYGTVSQTGDFQICAQIITDASENSNSDIPKGYCLSQNFPNPFNPSTVIRYDVPKSGLVSITVYDVLGREVRTLINEFKNAGSYSVELNAGNLQSGTYFYRMTAGEFTQIKKLILIK